MVANLWTVGRLSLHTFTEKCLLDTCDSSLLDTCSCNRQWVTAANVPKIVLRGRGGTFAEDTLSCTTKRNATARRSATTPDLTAHYKEASRPALYWWGWPPRHPDDMPLHPCAVDRRRQCEGGPCDEPVLAHADAEEEPRRVTGYALRHGIDYQRHGKGAGTICSVLYCLVCTTASRYFTRRIP